MHMAPKETIDTEHKLSSDIANGEETSTPVKPTLKQRSCTLTLLKSDCSYIHHFYLSVWTTLANLHAQVEV